VSNATTLDAQGVNYDFSVPMHNKDNLLHHHWSPICVRSTVLTISWFVNTTHQCIYSPVRLIKLNQSELEFGVKRRHRKKQTY